MGLRGAAAGHRLACRRLLRPCEVLARACFCFLTLSPCGLQLAPFACLTFRFPAGLLGFERPALPCLFFFARACFPRAFLDPARLCRSLRCGLVHERMRRRECLQQPLRTLIVACRRVSSRRGDGGRRLLVVFLLLLALLERVGDLLFERARFARFRAHAPALRPRTAPPHRALRRAGWRAPVRSRRAPIGPVHAPAPARADDPAASAGGAAPRAIPAGAASALSIRAAAAVSALCDRLVSASLSQART